jgi:SAM-dependent methyltransferase
VDFTRANGDRFMSVTSYDEVPYPSHSFPETQPSHLATVAALFGLRAPDPANCRVLELGCASGGNLIPLAVAWPQAQFVGVDLSSRQIADARQCAEQLGLPNLELHHRSILDLNAELGSFDYILCHGVYSWVPREVQDAILTLCHDRLEPDGIAYVSYNTYPGWHLQKAIRDMMLFHSGRFATPATRIAQARSFLEFLARWSPARDDPYGLLLRNEAASLSRKTDGYLFHEHLEVVNDPVYFREFVARCEAAGLRYLADVGIRTMLVTDLPSEVRESLRLLAPDPLDLEQYLDFLRNRTFRRSLLCRPGKAIDRSLRGTSVRDLLGASHLRPEQTGAPQAAGEERFIAPSGNVLTTADPVMRACLHALGESWPQAIPAPVLRMRVLERVDPGIRDSPDLAEGPFWARLQDYFIHGVIELHAAAPPVAGACGAVPCASPLARHQALNTDLVTNLRHQRVPLDAAERALLVSLDGSRALPEAPETAATLERLAWKSLLLARP